MVRPTYAEIDLDAIRHNVTELAALISPSLYCAVIKADAYGHGDVPVAETALDAGASWLAVALVEEGARLREAGIDSPILLLSEPVPAAVPDVVKWDLTPTVYSDAFISALADSGRRLGVHLKIDTGMHRVGAHPDRVGHLIYQVRRAGNLDLEGIWTHFPVADEDPVYTRAQIQRFGEMLAGIEVPLTHMANTPGAILFPEARADMCRVGLGTYGLHPCDETRGKADLRPAMKIVSQVTHIKRLPGGSRPSYGRTRELAGEATVATVPIGYADGYHRGLSREGEVLIGGRRHRLAGNVTMDQIVVDIGDEDVRLGDEVVLLGLQAGEEIGADEIAGHLGTISYEVVVSIGPRVPRRYVP